MERSRPAPASESDSDSGSDSGWGWGRIGVGRRRTAFGREVELEIVAAGVVAFRARIGCRLGVIVPFAGCDRGWRHAPTSGTAGPSWSSPTMSYRSRRRCRQAGAPAGPSNSLVTGKSPSDGPAISTGGGSANDACSSRACSCLATNRKATLALFLIVIRVVTNGTSGMNGSPNSALASPPPMLLVLPLLEGASSTTSAGAWPTIVPSSLSHDRCSLDSGFAMSDSQFHCDFSRGPVPTA